MNEYILTTHSYIGDLEGKTETSKWNCSGEKYILYHAFFYIIAEKVTSKLKSNE